jgi:hypothetical protein
MDARINLIYPLLMLLVFAGIVQVGSGQRLCLPVIHGILYCADIS